MAMLEAAMAFAVTMIIFSTITTGIVEFIHRIAGVRSKTLKNMARQLFDDYIWPRLNDSLDRLANEREDAAKRRHGDTFVAKLTDNPLKTRGKKPEGTVLSQAVAAAGIGGDAYFGKDIESLTQLSFAERLARTDVGSAIMAQGEEQLDDLINDFARTFDRLGRAASEFLGARARSLSIVVGIVLALAANISAGRLVTALMEDPDLRAGLIEQADQIAQENREAMKNLQDVAAQAKAGTLQGEQLSKAIEDASDAVSQKLKSLESAELPIGFSYFPHHCLPGVSGRELTTDEEAICNEIKGLKWEQAPSVIEWFILCVISGVLIGLGGPFWYQVFSRLSQIVQIARALGIRPKKEDKEASAADAPVDPQDTAKPKNVKDAFTVAAKVSLSGPQAAKITAHWS